MYFSHKKTLIITLIAICTTVAVSSSYAASPTQKRLNDRRTANSQEYFRCADFSLRVLQACQHQSAANINQSRGCRQHYQNNLGSCRANFQ